MKLRNDTVVYCQNKEEAIEFFNKCIESKFKWSFGEFIWPLKDADERFDRFGTYYFIHDNLLRWSNNMSIFRDCKYVNFKDLFEEDNMKFKVGDKVKIIDRGLQYPRYSSFIKDNLSKRLNDFVWGDIVNCNKEYKVLFIGKHEKGDINLCIIEDLNTKQIYIIDSIGVEVVSKSNKENVKIYEMPDYVENEVKKVIINEPCVIVFLTSGEKGVAKCCPEDKFDENIGYAIALYRARIEKNKNDMHRNNECIKQYIKIQDGFRVWEQKLKN